MPAAPKPATLAQAAPPPVFEDWSPGNLQRWSPASFPTGDGGTWTWAEPAAEFRVQDGIADLSVRKFTRKHDVVQIFDNPKHLVACRDPIPIPDQGITLDFTMAAAVHRAPSDEWGDGFASLNLMDFEHGLVLDAIANTRRTAVLFERLFIPGMIPRDQVFTAIAEGPRSPKPETRHDYRLQYEPLEHRVQGWVDGLPVLDMRNIPFRMNAFTPGLGLLTLRPIRDGASQSLRGQGATGRWGPLRVGTPARP